MLARVQAVLFTFAHCCWADEAPWLQPKHVMLFAFKLSCGAGSYKALYRRSETSL